MDSIKPICPYCGKKFESDKSLYMCNGCYEMIYKAVNLKKKEDEANSVKN